MQKCCLSLAILFMLISAAAYSQATAPSIQRQSENSSQVGLYEKYEIVLALKDAVYNNPYDPEEIDVRALFVSPTGRQWAIYGFYDNFQNRNQWKVRFAPNEAGLWSYSLSVTAPAGTGSSMGYTFTALPSTHRGWLHTSPVNPHYLVHDNGASFYGVATFWPWKINNTASGLGALQNAGCNLVGYWNVTYDDNTLIESMSSGLGRYDQNKCSRIDQILEWMEQRGMVLMLSIWPHDLFCLDMPGWAALWKSNPYNTLCTVHDIYANEAAWRYQEKQYRYIIARFGHSRGLGLWEIINEINGTDAWDKGRIPDAENWIRKVHAYLKQHDPYNRPTTASMSGGQWWPNGYAIFDMPNVHMYETGWPAKFNSNPLRSSLWTYHTVTRQMWEGFAKPAIMGEAGWLNSYGDFAGDSDEYAIMFHNALWSSWSSGLASSPVWWAYDARVMGPKVMTRLKMFSLLAPQLDYAHHIFQPAAVTVTSADAFAMADQTMAFGWARQEQGGSISEQMMQINGLTDSVYAVQWFDTWNGKVLETHIRPCQQGVLLDELPKVTGSLPDLAFTLRPAETGVQPSRLRLQATPRLLYSDGESRAQIQCLVFDEQGRFCSAAAAPLTFSMTGPGRLIGPTSLNTVRGLAGIVIQADTAGSGPAQIVVSSPGLVPDTTIITMTDVQLIDGFEQYGALNSLNLFWKVRTGTFAAIILQTGQTGAGGQSIRVDYAIGNGKPPYAGFFYTFPRAFKSGKFLRFWLQGDASNRDLVLLLNKDSSHYWQYILPLSSGSGTWIEIPLAAFTANFGPDPLDLTQVTSLSFNILKGNGADGAGTLSVDEIHFANSGQSAVTALRAQDLPQTLQLFQNYPNPFNAATEFRYSLPRRGQVELMVYNLRGQLIEKLAEGSQAAGMHRLFWKAEGQPSGAYFLLARTGTEVRIVKCVLLK